MIYVLCRSCRSSWVVHQVSCTLYDVTCGLKLTSWPCLTSSGRNTVSCTSVWTTLALGDLARYWLAAPRIGGNCTRLTCWLCASALGRQWNWWGRRTLMTVTLYTSAGRQQHSQAMFNMKVIICSILTIIVNVQHVGLPVVRQGRTFLWSYETRGSHSHRSFATWIERN